MKYLCFYLCSPERVYSQTHRCQHDESSIVLQWQDIKMIMIKSSSDLEMVLVAGEAAFPCHSHTLQQRTCIFAVFRNHG